MCVCVCVSTCACMHMCAGTCTHEHMHRVAMGFMRTLPQTELKAGSYSLASSRTTGQNSFVSLMRILIFIMRSLPDLLQAVGGRGEDAFSLFKRSDTNR